MAQENEPKPRISEAPLTEEQIAVYRAVLERFTKGSKGSLNLANKTDPFDLETLAANKECHKGMNLDPESISGQIVHRVTPAIALSPRMVLVDPDVQQKKVTENDPQNTLKRAIDGREPITEKQVDDSVERAFQTAIFTLSEIGFDKQHRRAIVSYSFYCGMLCGSGNTLILRKAGNRWKVSKTCGGYVS
jgi:hypothetical protein